VTRHPEELPHSVSVFSLYRAEPVYHDPEGAWGREEENEDGSYVWRSRSRCGLVSYSEKVKADGSLAYSSTAETRIPARHAVCFARPCLRCFPEMRES
jgi:hypothetical protein